MGRFSLVGISMSCAQLFNFFMSGIIMNYIFNVYPITWLVAVMLPMAFFFLIAVIFYIPYDELANTFSPKENNTATPVPEEETLKTRSGSRF